MQLHISERSGRGVPKIIKAYSKEVFEFRENSIVVTIPFNWLDKNRNNFKKEYQNKLDKRKNEIIKTIKKNPSVTQIQLTTIIGVSLTTIENDIRILKQLGYIKRIGSNKTGYWQLLN